MVRYFIIHCKNCKHNQKTHSKGYPKGSRKCVYCGKSITLNKNLIEVK